LLTLGWLGVWYDDDELLYYRVARDDPRGPHWVVAWDVIPALGMVGLVALPIAYFVPRDVMVSNRFIRWLPVGVREDNGDQGVWSKMSDYGEGEEGGGDITSVNETSTSTMTNKARIPARLLTAIGMLSVYQLLLATWGWWFNFAHRSVHGGIFGGMMVLPAVLLIGSHVFEELQKMNTEENHDSAGSGGVSGIKARAWIHRRQLLYLLKFTLITGITGGLLSFVPHMFPSKRLSSSIWALVSLSTVGFVAMFFMFFDKVLQFNTKRSFLLLRSLGFNPFLCYNIVFVVGVNQDIFCFASKAREERAEILVGILLPITVAVVSIWLYLRNRCIDTLKVTLGTTAIIVLCLVFRIVVTSAPETLVDSSA